ncbi:hypothetical protein T492DRAFT_1048192 [Pavlovales sp. CCMP2436]|nr:hypothetical protein T492DRAFT_1048192 [Pavlovales sp. CCMP2436]
MIHVSYITHIRMCIIMCVRMCDVRQLLFHIIRMICVIRCITMCVILCELYELECVVHRTYNV